MAAVPENSPALIFFAIQEDKISRVEVFLNESLYQRLTSGEKFAWQGLIEHIEDELSSL